MVRPLAHPELKRLALGPPAAATTLTAAPKQTAAGSCCALQGNVHCVRAEKGRVCKSVEKKQRNKKQEQQNHKKKKKKKWNWDDR
jgi:hypothetical protein